VTILVARELAKSYGADVVFAGVSFTVGRGDRLGLVGPNGAGKTTLLEILAGRLEPDAGEVRLVGQPRVAYLEQEPWSGPAEAGTLFEACAGALDHLARWEERLATLERELAGLDEGDPRFTGLADEYDSLLEAYRREQGYAREARVREVLFGLGFGWDDLGLPLTALSGGQRTRARLARLLLSQPDLLLLDEPTNHLDLEALEWLEAFLGEFQGSVLAVSHDRHFLDRLARRILELDRGRLTIWTGDYTAYVAQREAALGRALEAYERQQEEIRRLEDYVRRNIAGQKSRSAESRRKVLERMERLERPVTHRRRPGLRFEPTAASGREVLTLRDVGVALADPAEPGRAPRWLFGDVSAEVRRGERVALVGRNGAGKSTLLEVIAGLRPPTTGEVLRGAGVRPAYLPQDPPAPVGTTVLEEVLARTGLDLPSARALLGRFLFSGDEVDRPVGALSRGERTRLALACLVAAVPNLLILDEPTGHLDLPSREALEQALASFPGTLLVVSHDRYFLQKVATRVWELDAGRLVDFPGPYEEYRRWRLSRAETSETVPRVRASEGAAPRASGPRPTPQLSKGRRARIEAELWGVLEEIDRLERRRSELEARLADPETYRSGAGAATAAEYRETQARLEQADRRWAELSAALEPPGPAGPDPRG